MDGSVTRVLFNVSKFVVSQENSRDGNSECQEFHTERASDGLLSSTCRAKSVNLDLQLREKMEQSTLLMNIWSRSKKTRRSWIVAQLNLTNQPVGQAQSKKGFPRSFNIKPIRYVSPQGILEFL